MAGVVLTMKQAQDYCANMAKPGNYLKPLKICNQIAISGVRKGFTDQAAPDGTPWKPLAWSTIVARMGGMKKFARKMRSRIRRSGRGGSPGSRGVQILRDDGFLLGSVSSLSAVGSIGHVTRDEATLGSNLVYAAIHQFGGMAGRGHKTKIPARPYIGHRPENIPRYEKVFAEHEEKRAEGDGSPQS